MNATELESFNYQGYSQTRGWGVGVPPQLAWQNGLWIAQQALEVLEPDCWSCWAPEPVVPWKEERFFPTIYSSSQVTLAVNRLYKQLCPTIIHYNEPERPDQSNTAPSDAVATAKQFLKEAWDTGRPFRWAAPGVWAGESEHGYDGLRWLDEYVRNSSTPGLRFQGIQRPTLWHVHPYRSGSLDIIQRSWRRWNNWYKTWGAHAPVMISEVCAENADLDTQKQVMHWTRGLLDSGEVTSVVWFAAYRHDDANWPRCALTDVDLVGRRVTLNALGQYWRSLK